MSRRRVADLIPEFYRLRDALDGDGLLGAFVQLLDDAVQEFHDELDDRYDDLFVETAGRDELAHFAALLGVRELPGRRPPRALVAGVLGYRRRKGTVAVLEDVARAATGWTAKATEQRTLLCVSTSLLHVGPGAGAVPAVRDPVRGAGTPFDTVPTTVDVRAVETAGGRRNIPNVTVDLWRLEPVPEGPQAAVPVAGDDRRFRFHPLGLDVPLATIGDPEHHVGHLATRLDVSAPLTMVEARALWDALYGEDDSFVVLEAGAPVAAAEVVLCDLGDVPGGWRQPPATSRVAVDPTRGRLTFTVPPAGPVGVRWVRLLPAHLGGGGYPRPAGPEGTPDVTGAPAGRTAVRLAAVAGPDIEATTLTEAFAMLASRGGSGVVEIVDGGRYEPAALAVPTGGAVQVRAVDQRWPVLTEGLDVAVDDGGTLLLDGLLVTGGPVRVTGAPARVTLRHVTVVPGSGLDGGGALLDPASPALVLATDPGVEVTVRVDRCVLGRIEAPDDVALEVTDSIVAGQPVDHPASLRTVCTGAVPAAAPAPGNRSLLVRLGLGTELTVAFVSAAADLTTLATELQDAIADAGRADLGDDVAGLELDLATTTVTAHEGRLVCVGPGLDALTFADAPGSIDATDLALTAAAGAVTGVGVLGHPVAGPPDAGTPPLPVRVRTPAGEEWTAHVDLAVAPADLADAGRRISAALAAAHAGGGLAFARDGRLVVAPLVPGATVRVDDGPAAAALGLHVAAPALGAGTIPGGPALAATRTTWFGDVVVRSVELSDSIVTGALSTARRQRGCVRYSWLGAGSVTPRRFRSRGADAGDAAPTFGSRTFGHPAFGQLRPGCPAPVATGAENGSEMGAFNDVDQAGRLAAARSLLDEYLRFQSRAGIFLVS